KRARQGLDPVEPIYTLEDAQNAMQYFVSIPYDKEFNISPEISLKFTDNGPILGSATVNLAIKDGRKTTRVAFTGDIGRYSKRILKAPQPFPQADYIIMESTYGDRLHENVDESESQLLSAVQDTCVKKKGKLIIPSFAIGRAQEIIYALDKLTHKGLLPDVDVYVDSPLSINATNIMRLHTECFNKEFKKYMKEDNDPFGFDRLQYVRSKEKSKALNSDFRPMIIISASGMMEAGRVKHHIANNIENHRTTILGVGYCAPSTLGHRILRGDKEVSLFGVKYRVKAEIRTIDSYSAHADYNEMLKFLDCQDKTQIKGIFLVHGEEETQKNFKRTLRLNGYSKIRIPAKKEVIEI
ncbi:MAG: MBL fold metallo-hydrolase, partial [Bacteroidales bacterium]|nr:MBL fold metallo-hydrolase [Bacteroidales bacterium]